MVGNAMVSSGAFNVESKERTQKHLIWYFTSLSFDRHQTWKTDEISFDGQIACSVFLEIKWKQRTEEVFSTNLPLKLKLFKKAYENTKHFKGELSQN